MASSREELVPEDRLTRAWSVIADRVSGLGGAIPDVYIQGGGTQNVNGEEVKTHPVAVFAIAEANPRHVGMLQISTTHMLLSGWHEMETEAAHLVSQGFDPLQWCLLQAAKGHLHTMNGLRQMNHAVTRINAKGETEVTYPTGQN